MTRPLVPLRPIAVLGLALPLATLLSCTLVTKDDFAARQDFDGDSFVASQFGGDDCDDNAPDVNPAAPEVCDGIDNDCDGTADNDDATDAPTWYADADGDGYGGGSVTACQRPEGYVPNADDCNDASADVNPGVTDVWYDGEDSDCGGNSDLDKDGDGFDSAEYGGTDCNDEDPAINPGATEIWYDTADQDCSAGSDFDQDSDGHDSEDWGGQDCNDEDGSIHPDADDAWYDGIDSNCDDLDDFDQDGDGHGNTGSGGDDCDDGDVSIYAGATEYCDTVDQDCDDAVDDAESLDAGTYYADTDGDRYGNPDAPQNACSQPAGFVTDSQDCDDTSDTVTYITWFGDSDGDNYGNAVVSATSCTKPVGYVSDDTDCDDLAGGTNPGELEVCDVGDVDEDCNGAAEDDDAGATGKLTYYEDRDGDGFGDPDRSAEYCDPASRYIVDGTDCDDGDSAIKPSATEKCDAADTDEDCDGLVDDDDDSVTGQTSYYTDSDGDGYGAGSATLSCDVVVGKVLNSNDCNDGNAAINPATGDCDISLADADAKLTGDGANAYAGEFLSAAGDVNGDGYGDFLVGAYHTALSGASSSEGEAYLMCGPVNASATFADSCADIYGDRPSGQAGSGVAGLGDIDGDGYDDVAVGVGTPSSVAVFLGPLSGSYSSSTADATLTMGTLGEIAGAGDVDGDGVMDLLIGNQYESASAGAVYLITVPTSGTISLASATASLSGEAANDYAGAAIAGGADFDGDGLDDIAVGAPYHDTDSAGLNEGAVYAMFGPVSGSLGLGDADVKLVGETNTYNTYRTPKGGYAGVSLEDAGDVNNDGYADLLIGASDAGYSLNGYAYLELGPLTSSGLEDADAVISSTADDASLGAVISGVGDANADGYADLLLHALRTDGEYDYLGYNYVFLGPVSGALDDDADSNGALIGEARYDGNYSALAGAGDIDADGRDDLLIGSYMEDSGGTDAGAVYLMLGSNF